MPSSKPRLRRINSPSPESVDRMLAFASFLSALEDGDGAAEAIARKELNELGLEVRVKGGAH